MKDREAGAAMSMREKRGVKQVKVTPMTLLADLEQELATVKPLTCILE